jgi:hypothetical protein
MNLDNFTKPLLIEPGIKYTIKKSLLQCKDFKNKYNNIIYNIVLFVLFIIILGAILLYKFKGKMTTEEKKQNNIEKLEYILSKMKIYKENKLKDEQKIITNLPYYDKEYI